VTWRVMFISVVGTFTKLNNSSNFYTHMHLGVTLLNCM